MPKVQLTQVQINHGNAVYAKGGFVPRRKGQRYPGFVLHGFYNQQGELNAQFALPEDPRITSTVFLGTFVGYGHYDDLCTYRAFRVNMADGSVVAGYSKDDDQYVLCQNQGYLYVG